MIPFMIPFTNTDTIHRHMARTIGAEKKLIEGGSKIATEAISNIRTVASLRGFQSLTIIYYIYPDTVSPPLHNLEQILNQII